MAASKPDVCSALTSAVSRAVAVLREHRDWRLKNVISPCLAWCRDKAEAWDPIEVGVFGSTQYGLCLASSDFDIALVVRPGCDWLRMLKHLLKVATRDSRTTCHTKEVAEGMRTLKLEFFGICVDIQSVRASRSADTACCSTDLLKLMLEERRAVVGAVEAVHAFKLLAHHLHLCQHHMEHRRAQFKAISLCFFACAIIDYVRPLSGDVAASAAGTYLLTIIEAFRLFDWRTLMVRVTMEGRTLIIKKQLAVIKTLVNTK